MAIHHCIPTINIIKTLCLYEMYQPLTGAKDGYTMKDIQYPNAVYDNAVTAPYVQYNQSTSESNMVGNLHNAMYRRMLCTLFLRREFMNSVATQQSMPLWIRLCLG